MCLAGEDVNDDVREQHRTAIIEAEGRDRVERQAVEGGAIRAAGAADVVAVLLAVPIVVHAVRALPSRGGDTCQSLALALPKPPSSLPFPVDHGIFAAPRVPSPPVKEGRSIPLCLVGAAAFRPTLRATRQRPLSSLPHPWSITLQGQGHTRQSVGSRLTSATSLRVPPTSNAQEAPVQASPRPPAVRSPQTRH